MGVRWPILALVGVGGRDKYLGNVLERWLMGWHFWKLICLKNASTKNTDFWEIGAVKKMVSFFNSYEPKPSSKDLRGIQF